MKKFVAIVFAVFLFLPRLAFAEFGTCSGNNQPHGDSDFSIVHNALVTADSGYSVTLERGNSGYVLWYTDADKIPDDYKAYQKVFNESGLEVGSHYNVLITYESATNTLTYYRKLDSESESSYVEMNQATQDLGNGNGSFKVEGDNVTEVKCSDEIETPTIPEPDPIEVCELFPSPAQTWVGNDTGKLSMQNTSLISGAPQSNGKRYVGFPDIAYDNDNYTGQATCDGEECFYDPSLRVQRLDLEYFPESSEVVDVGQGERTFSDSDNTVLKELNVFNQGKAFFESGKYWFEKLTLAGTTLEVLSGQDVEIHVKTLNLSNQAKFFASDNAKLVVIVHGENTTIIDNIEFTGLLYSEGTVELHNSQAVVYGAVTAKNLLLNTSSKIIATDNHCFTPEPSDDYELSMSPSTQLALMCGSDLPTFEIVTKSGSDFVSTPVNISIPNADVGFTLNAATGSGNICSISSSSNSCSFSSDSNGKLVLTVAANGNNAVIAAHSYNLRASLVEDSEQSQTASFSFVPYKIDVKPHSESAWNNQVIPAIANKSVSIDARVLACPAGESSAPVVLDYNKTLNNSALSVTLSEPSTGSGNVRVDSLQFVDGQTGSGGVAVTFDESGVANVVVKDTEFSCSNFQELVDPETGKCPIEGEVLQGVFSVKARPWKFAVCALDSQGNNTAADGNSDDKDSVGYVAAGDAFSVRVAPLKYGSSECSDLEQLTHNYFLSDAAVELTHELDTPQKGTKGSLTGALTRQVTLSDKNTNGYVFSDLKYDEVGSIQLAVTETGAFYSPIEVDGSVGVSGERNIGRFYPDSLVLISNEWNYESGHDGFAYMNQPISYDFVVEAQNTNGGATTNYGHFAPSLIADIKLLAVEKINATSDTQELNSRIEDFDIHFWGGEAEQWLVTGAEGEAQDGSRLQIDGFSFQFNKNQTRSDPVTTLEDGPYTNGFGLRVSSQVDDVDFSVSDETKLELRANNEVIYKGVTFPGQPDIRYGRISMEDVGGASISTIKIPLRTEYWNGTRFVTNDDDSGSFFRTSSDYMCAKRIWPGSGATSDAALAGADESPVSVIRGVSDKLSAAPHSSSQDDSVREQIRFWLRSDAISSSSPQLSEDEVICGSGYTNQPWLQYNWRNKGDEDPSSVVTFGIHRGNDRVIYRGEPGLTGL